MIPEAKKLTIKCVLNSHAVTELLEDASARPIQAQENRFWPQGKFKILAEFFKHLLSLILLQSVPVQLNLRFTGRHVN